MRRKLTELFGIDPRALAALRIGLGVLLLCDLAVRSTCMVAHYTDAGVFPREMLDQYYAVWYVSLHSLSGGAALQWVLFAIAAVAAVCVLAGYRTTLATVVSWALITSLQMRNPLVLNAGDGLFRLLLFWSMFVPLGQVWSVDALRRGGRELMVVSRGPSSAIVIQNYPSLGTLAIQT